MMAKVRMPNSGNCTAMDCRLRMLRNLPGSRMLNATKMTMAMMSNRNVLLSIDKRSDHVLLLEVALDSILIFG